MNDIIKVTHEITTNPAENKMNKVGAIIRCRMGSSRLPGKVMKEVNGKPLIQIMIERLKNCLLVDEIIIATSTSKNNDNFCQFLDEKEFKYHRGSEDNVLQRVLDAAKKFDIDAIFQRELLQNLHCRLKE